MSKGTTSWGNYGKKITRFQRSAVRIPARLLHKFARKKIPFLGRILDRLAIVPLYVRIICLISITLWKCYIIYVLLRFLKNYNGIISSPSKLSADGLGVTDAIQFVEQVEKNYNNPLARLSIPHNKDEYQQNNKFNESIDNGQKDTPNISPNKSASNNEETPPFRVLHIVTSLSEYQTGDRDTVKGSDRLQEVMIPILVDSVSTMILPPYNYQVDVYLILAWSLKLERRRVIEDALPEGVGLEVWDDAMPLGYNLPEHTKIMEIDRALARQHRFVMKDKLDYYDLFSAFEDDMRITGAHISYYLEASAELDRIKEEAPDTLPREPKGWEKEHFHGPMSKVQAQRLIPGFIRAEVLLDETKWPVVSELGSIPVDLQFELVNKDGTTTTEHRTFDPIPCCNVSGVDLLTENPQHSQIMLWETAINAANVRQLPKGKGIFDWVLLLSGPMIARNEKFIGGYWSGRGGALGPDIEKPVASSPKYFAQQGGWMATQKQLIFMHSTECFAGIFPPYDTPRYLQDGLLRNNVEFWSGGVQVYGGLYTGCNMQRVINMHPDHFSKHFLYHASNNKQKASLLKDRVVKVDDFYGQLNSVVKAARKTIKKESND